MTQETPAKSKSSSNMKIGIGIATTVVAVGLGYLLLRKKPDAVEAGTTPAKEPNPAPPKPTEPVEPTPHEEVAAIYSAPNGVRVDKTRLPIIMPLDPFVVYSPSVELSEKITKIVADATGATNSGVGNLVGDPLTWFQDFMTRVTLDGVESPADLKQELDSTGTWIAHVPFEMDDPGVNVALAKEYLKNFRKAIGNKRVLWVLGSNAPGNVAQALNESNEEWFRAPSEADDPKLGLDRLLTAPTMEEIAARFPVTSVASHPLAASALIPKAPP